MALDQLDQSLDTYLQTGDTPLNENVVNANSTLVELQADESYSPPFTINGITSESTLNEREVFTVVKLRVTPAGEKEYRLEVSENGSSPHALLECFRHALGERLEGIEMKKFLSQQTMDETTVRVVLQNGDTLYVGEGVGQHHMSATRDAVASCLEAHLAQPAKV